MRSAFRNHKYWTYGIVAYRARSLQPFIAFSDLFCAPLRQVTAVAVWVIKFCPVHFRVQYWLLITVLQFIVWGYSVRFSIQWSKAVLPKSTLIRSLFAWGLPLLNHVASALADLLLLQVSSFLIASSSLAYLVSAKMLFQMPIPPSRSQRSNSTRLRVCRGRYAAEEHLSPSAVKVQSRNFVCNPRRWLTVNWYYLRHWQWKLLQHSLLWMAVTRREHRQWAGPAAAYAGISAASCVRSTCCIINIAY